MLHLHTNDRWKQSCLKKIVSVFVSWGQERKNFRIQVYVFPLPTTFSIPTYNSSFGGIKNSVTQPWEFGYYYNGSRKFSDTYKDILILCSEYWDTRIVYTTNKQKISVVCWMGLGKRLPLKDNMRKILSKHAGINFKVFSGKSNPNLSN